MKLTKHAKSPSKKRREFEQVTNEPFDTICHDMYKRFGGAFKNLKPLCRNEADTKLLLAQLFELRTEVRRLLEEARNA